MFLLIGGGFDTTTALTAHSLEWLSEHPADRDRLRADLAALIDTATEEFFRVYTPAPGDGRTVTCEYKLSGMNSRRATGCICRGRWPIASFDVPRSGHCALDRKHNRHASFGLGLHRCIGSNVARALFKTMLTAVLERMPDYRCDPAGAVHYDTIGVINGMKHLPATFTPGSGWARAWTRPSRTGRRSSTSSAWPSRSPGSRGRSPRPPESHTLRRFHSSGIDRLRLTGSRLYPPAP